MGAGERRKSLYLPHPTTPRKKKQRNACETLRIIHSNFLVIQGLRIRLPTQETWVLSLPLEDPTGCVTCTLDPGLCNY